jgi:hypothetical protein
MLLYNCRGLYADADAMHFSASQLQGRRIANMNATIQSLISSPRGTHPRLTPLDPSKNCLALERDATNTDSDSPKDHPNNDKTHEGKEETTRHTAAAALKGFKRTDTAPDGIRHCLTAR